MLTFNEWFCFLRRHTVGDTKVPFCLQSCVKPLKYAVAVHDHGTEYVHSFIGKEPSGLRFNKLFLNEDGETLPGQNRIRSLLLRRDRNVAVLPPDGFNWQ